MTFHFPFQNTFARLPDRFFARVAPTPVAAPRLIRLNLDLAADLGLDAEWLAGPAGRGRPRWLGATRPRWELASELDRGRARCRHRGGPRPRKSSSASAQVIMAKGVAYVVDCGDGVARQLVFADVPLTDLRNVFITHHHSDHNADYGNLLLLAWAAGLRTRVDCWGPPPLKKMTQLFFEMNAYDINTRIADEGRIPLVPLVHVHELRNGGQVMQDENVTVTAALVRHPPVVTEASVRRIGQRHAGFHEGLVHAATKDPRARREVRAIVHAGGVREVGAHRGDVPLTRGEGDEIAKLAQFHKLSV